MGHNARSPKGTPRTGMSRTNEKSPVGSPAGLSGFKPGSDLLWHARGAHYHRRRAFSLPSSEWDRVVPARYGRQANCLRFAIGTSRSRPRLSNPVKFFMSAIAFGTCGCFDACRVHHESKLHGRINSSHQTA
jgi:hypothetical protein